MASALNLDMHGVSEAIAGVVAGGNLDHPTIVIAVAAQDAQARRSPRNAKRLGDFRAGGHRLNILRHLRNRDSAEPFELLEQRGFTNVDGIRNVGERGMDIGFSKGDRLVDAAARPHAVKPRPFARRLAINLFGQLARQRDAAVTLERHLGIARILQNFANVRQRLVGRTAARTVKRLTP